MDLKKGNETAEQNNNEHDENSINIYDDNAYMLEEDDYSENNSLQNVNNQIDLKNNKYNMQEQRTLFNNNKDNEIEGLDEIQNEDNQANNNYLNYSEQKFDVRNNQMDNNINNNIDINSINPNKNNINMKDKETNDVEFENRNENMGEEGEVQEQEYRDDENIPLVTLKYISICQYCKNTFDSKTHLPYLFKCGHFFCKECIEEQFTDEEGIKCPIDGLIAQSIKEFKLLNNLITDKNVPSQRNNNKVGDKMNTNSNSNLTLNLNDTCQIHKGQKLTHIIVNTKEIVCIYCAFDLVRKNPNCEVRELKEKFDEYSNIADKIINLNQNNVEIIQKLLKDIKDNKNHEEKKVNFYFDHILKYINTKKEEILSKIDSIFTENATKLSKKLENFSEQIELGESLKGLINDYNKNNNCSYNDIYESYLRLESLNEAEKNNRINLQEYKFIHDDETKMIKYINCFGDIKCIYKYATFHGDLQNYYDIDYNNGIIDEKNNIYKSNIHNKIISPQIINKDITNNNSYYLNNLILNENKNKSLFLNSKKDDLLNDDIGNDIYNSSLNRTNIYSQTFNNNNLSKINNKRIQLNNNMINENNINFMNYYSNQVKDKVCSNYDYFNNTFYKPSKKYYSSKRANSNTLYRNNKKNNKDPFHRISSPGNYNYDFKRFNK